MHFFAYNIYFLTINVSTPASNVSNTQLNQALKIEANVCMKNKNEEKFFKFHFIYDNL